MPCSYRSSWGFFSGLRVWRLTTLAKAHGGLTYLTELHLLMGHYPGLPEAGQNN